MNKIKTISTIIGTILTVLFLVPSVTYAKKPAKAPVKAKFYDFSDQLIDGRVKKPQTFYVDVRKKAEFGRLLRLKRDFMGRRLLDTAKLPVFK